MLPLDCDLDFDLAREEEFFAALPPCPAVFLIEPREGVGGAAGARAQSYLLRTADLRRRLERLLRSPEAPSKRLNLREFAGRVRYRLVGSAFEQSLVFYQHARRLYPRTYRDLLRLRPPALLRVNLANAYPRCYVTRRLGGRAFYYGPFASRRAAEAFASEFLDLFKIRRCQIKIRRDPSFPGCIYSEMKMCLAPCFAGCTKEEHDAEVGHVVSFLGTSGASLTGALGREREAASEALDFERAAALHRRLEKVAEVLRGLPELARPVEELDAVILQLAEEENTIAVFAVRGGFIADPFFLRFSELASRPRSAEEVLREHLGASDADHSTGAVERSPGTVVRSAGFQPAGLGADAGTPSTDGVPPAGEHKTAGGDAGAATNSAQPGVGVPHERSGEELGEHLALVARWFYSKPRHGEICFTQEHSTQRSAEGTGVRESGAPQQQLGFTFPAGARPAAARESAARESGSRESAARREWPYRRILRACSRLLAPPQEQKDDTQK